MSKIINHSKEFKKMLINELTIEYKSLIDPETILKNEFESISGQIPGKTDLYDPYSFYRVFWFGVTIEIYENGLSAMHKLVNEIMENSIYKTVGHVKDMLCIEVRIMDPNNNTIVLHTKLMTYLAYDLPTYDKLKNSIRSRK